MEMSAFGLCSVDGCGRTHYARGWCALHWKRWHRTGAIEVKKATWVPRCPVESCNNPVRLSTLVVCGECWRRTESGLRRDFVEAYHDWRYASQNDRAEAKARLDDLRSIIVIKAEGTVSRLEALKRRRSESRREVERRIQAQVKPRKAKYPLDLQEAA